MPVLRVSAKTHPMQNAKAISGLIHKHNHAEVQAIGRLAVHQAMKAITQATGYLKEHGIYVGFTAKYIAMDTDGNEKEGFRFFIDLL
jgi:stage V sporulation protein SpoVS